MGKAVMVDDARRQSMLEARLKQIWERGVSQSAQVAAVFGLLESWVLPVGTHRLLLHPVLKEWLYYDAVHDSWQPTGIAPGEGVFYAQGKHLGLKRAPAAGSPGVPQAYPAAGARPAPGLPPAMRRRRALASRCPTCGTRLKPAQRFCNRCGKALTEESPLGHRP